MKNKVEKKVMNVFCKSRRKLLHQMVISIFVFGSVSSVFCGCGNTAKKTNTKAAQPITIVSREDGSGTRGAFIELSGVETKDSQGNKTDHTTQKATIANSTEIMMTTVAGDRNAIGYASMGSLNDTVKALKLNGVECTAANIKNGTYKMSRPFNIVTKKKPSKISEDFIRYILSADGQNIVSKNGYVTMKDNAKVYSKPAKASGKIVVAGSSSVTPVMEKLAEEYQKTNPNVKIEVQESDSTTGVTSATNGNCDIGMASRALTDDEKAAGVGETPIALDGIAMIVNKQNTRSDIQMPVIKNIFTGKIVTWDKVQS